MSQRQLSGSYRRGRRGVGVFGLSAFVGVWWLFVGGTVLPTLSGSVSATPLASTVAASGVRMTVHLPGLASAPFPIAADRAAFEMARRGYADADEALLDEAYATSEWIAVTHGQPVQIVTRDGDAALVQVLNGPYSGRQGWLNVRQLAP